MIDISKGRYWDEGITLVDGCTPCSPGCDHCWSAAIAPRFCQCDSDGNPCFVENNKFTGDILPRPDRLKRFNTHKPKVFAIWNDLFHENVPNEFIFQCLNAGLNGNRRHTYLVLTKRPRRMKEFFEKNSQRFWHYHAPNEPKRPNVSPEWPDDKLWNGLTVCNQQEADEKIPIFLQVPGKKFLSIEPMLGAIDLMKASYINQSFTFGKINAVVIGGETGPGARPLHPDWVRSVKDQCAAAGVPFFFKQMLVKRGCEKKLHPTRLLDGRTHDDLPWNGEK